MKFRLNVVAIIEKDEKILFGRKAPGVSPYTGKWLLPGGGVNDENESIDEAMKREILEETNLLVIKMERLFFGEDVTERHGNVIRLIFLYYKITDTKNWDDAKPGSDLVKLQWIPKSELRKLSIPPISHLLFQKLGYIT